MLNHTLASAVREHSGRGRFALAQLSAIVYDDATAGEHFMGRVMQSIAFPEGTSDREYDSQAALLPALLPNWRW
jgi:hypothetical protein